jgi:pimeloyl-ACP methyl ester carboxylesterase
MIWKKVLTNLIMLLCILPACITTGLPNHPEKTSPSEIWIAFFHGLGGNASVNRPLIENISIMFQQQGITLKYINPSLPNDVSLEEWSTNIAQTIFDWAKNETQTQPWIILVGHSMGGKAALHAVAQNLKNIDTYVSSVITINSPIKNLGRYRPFTYFWNGLLLRLLAKQYLHETKVVAIKDCRDIDTSIDGKTWVEGTNRSWLSFISAEAYPTDPAYDLKIQNNTIDPYPRYMDDGLVPIDAQYTDDATPVYYGTCGHQAMEKEPAAIQTLANTTVRYLLGEPINVSSFSDAWVYDHQAIRSTFWDDVVGRDETLIDSGYIFHAAGVFPPYQWVDVVGGNHTSNLRSRYETQQICCIGSLIKNVSWVSSNQTDYRLKILSQSLPLGKIELDWRVYGIIPPEHLRDHYEVEVLDGSSYGHSRITNAEWASSDCTDIGINIRSWVLLGTIKIEWRVYLNEPKQFPDMSDRYDWS